MGSVKSSPRRLGSLRVSTERADAEAIPLRSATTGATGFVLADIDFRPVYANDAALRILNYPRELAGEDGVPPVHARLQSIFTSSQVTMDLPASGFVSGRRRYVCRPFMVEAAGRPPMAAFVIERRSRDLLHLGEIGPRFHLSRRECETVQHLVLGLTTKEVARRMGVSPNTVKQFVRLVMSKMGVTTRSGIVGKLIDREASDPARSGTRDMTRTG
jgi:DNA-binding CsgD family transcriptional regulator